MLSKTSRKKNPKPTSGELEKRLNRLDRIVHSVPRNMKYIIKGVVSSAGIVTASPYSLCINTVATGTDEVSRIGDKLKFHWLEFSINFVATTSLIATTFVRYVLVREKTTLGAAVSYAQYLDTATPSASLALRNWNTRDQTRFVTIFDSGAKVLGRVSNATPVNFAEPDQIAFHHHFPLDFIADYSRGTAGTVADIDTNGVTLLVFTDTSTASAVNTNYSATFCFED